MNPEDLRYTRDHEWIRVEGETATLGITDHAQDSLGDIVYLETPAVGREVAPGEEIGEVESTKTTSPIYTPVGGTISEINTVLKDQPEIVNKDPYKQGWIVRIRMKDAKPDKPLLSAGEYEAFLKTEGD